MPMKPTLPIRRLAAALLLLALALALALTGPVSAATLRCRFGIRPTKFRKKVSNWHGLALL